VDWLFWFCAVDEEPDFEPDFVFVFDAEDDFEDDVVLLYALSFTFVPCFCTHAVTAELALLPPPMPPPPMPPPPIPPPSWM
jgi:hypothetical protein